MPPQYDDQYASYAHVFNPLTPGRQDMNAPKLLGNYTDGIIIRPSERVSEEQYIYHTLILDSQDRDRSKYAEASDYVLNVPFFRDVVSMELVNLSVAKGESLINKNNNSFSFAESENTKNTPLTVTIPSGKYDAASLIGTLVQKMNAVSTSGVTYSANIDNVTGKLQLSGSPSQYLAVVNGDILSGKYKLGDISKMLGILPICPEAADGIITGTYAVDLTGVDYIILEIEGISNNFGSNDALQGSFAQVVIADMEYGQYKHLRGVDWGQCLIRFNPFCPKLGRFHIKFKRPDGLLYDFGGFEHSMVFKLKCKFKAMDY